MTTKITGTAAVGAALPKVTVQAKCASGSGTATTADNGTFTVSIDNAVRPCVLSAPAPDGTTLHSIVEAGAGTTPVANITPLTELVLAALVKGDTNAFFAGFDASAQSQLTPANVATALAQISTILSTVVNLSNTDPIKGQLVAANGANAGNVLDQLLDRLAAQLAKAKTTLPELIAAVSSNAGAPAIQTILKPASAACAGLRTGDYLGATPVGVATVRIDAATLAVTQLDSAGLVVAQSQLVPIANEACRYSLSAQGLVSDVQMSPSGVMLVRNVANANNVRVLPNLLVPAQALTLADLAGAWNGLGFEYDGQAFKPSRVTFTVDAAGKFTAGADCTGLSSCSAWEELPTLSAAGGSGFALEDSQGTAYVAAFRGTDGLATAVVSSPNGIIIASKQVVRPLPVVGTTNAYWDLTVFGDLSVQTASASTTITAVNPATNAYTRTRNDGRVDTWTQNKPVNGLRYRAPSGDATAREALSLTLGNTGVGVLIGLELASQFYDISVNRPQ
ncbi:hypothetical protein [Cupriavidus sp. SZY C1]|uniref:hypothetical protein n=1 Tax=Cupriavidus sp. SZY C1 TaxID=3055037 RepID=UPI0028BDAB45|nr:hypothetical protein [Cupriavidus sp. SZY C1]